MVRHDTASRLPTLAAVLCLLSLVSFANAATAQQTRSPRETITRQAGVLAALDLQLAMLLQDDATELDPKMKLALALLRERATTIIDRVTHALGDEYPCGLAGSTSATADRPTPDEFVPYEKAAKLVRMDAPDYPLEAERNHVEGTVMLRVLVNADGQVEDVIVLQSIPMLDEAAKRSARTAVFEPATRDGRPVAVWMVLPVEFRLTG